MTETAAMFAAVAIFEALAILTLCGLAAKMERRHGRRVDTLLDRLAHSEGRTWTPPPRDLEPIGSAPEPPDYDPFQEPY